jgi:hypothetical protein
MAQLWSSTSQRAWNDALASYTDVIAKQGVARLAEHDRWYREELAASIIARKPRHVTHSELVRLTEWKMARGVWRAPNLVLVRRNDEDAVIATSTDALSRVPHPTAPISTLAKLKGVGPATASAVAAAAEPSVYPFFDELVAEQVPALGKVAWTLGYYARYASALRERAAALGPEWTVVMVERAVWSSLGGKAGTA